MKKFLTLLAALIVTGSMTVVQADTWTPAGTPASVFTNEWTPNTPANDMVLSNGLYVFAKRSDFAQTSIQFKVCKDHAWTTAYPGSNYSFTIPAGAKHLIITYNPSGNAVNAFAISSMTVAGDNGTLFGNTWDPTKTANDMVLQSDGTYKFEKSGVALSAGTINFKACANHAWTNAWPSSNYSLSIPESGNYTITITFNPATLSVSATADLEEAVVVIPTIQLHSNITNPSWEASANFALAGNEETATLTLTGVTKGNYEFGIKIDGTWTSNGSGFTRANPSHTIAAGSGNCTFNADVAGDYTFTWTYADNSLSVTYPELPAQFVEFNGLASQILKGTEVTFAATSTGITNPVYTYFVKPAGGEYGSAVASYTFNTEGNFVVKVSAEGDNTIAPVVAEESVSVYGAHTFTNGTTIYVDFSAMTEGTKGVNYPKVGEVGLDYDAAGAGTVKTITFSTDVTWTTMADAFIKTEKNGWAALKFSVPGDGQNCAVVAADGASFTWSTHTAPVVTVEAKGEWDGWTDALAFVPDGSGLTATATLADLPAGNYDFKLIVDGNWLSNANAFHRFWTSASGITSNNDLNMELQADADGDYILTWTFATNALSITFPETPKTGTNEVKFFPPRTEEHPWNSVYVYAWRRTAGEDARLTDEWPGDLATKDGEWYKATIAKGACAIFHDNAGMQSFDIENVQKDACYVVNAIDNSEHEADPEKPIKAKFYESCTVNFFITGDEGIMGAGNAWKENLPERQLNGSNSITLSNLPAGIYEFKLTNGSWAWSIGGKEHLKGGDCSNVAVTSGSGNVKFKIESTQDVTITYFPATQQICLSAETMLPFEDVRTGLTADNYYTVCYNREMKQIRGASLWSFAGKDANFAYLVREDAPFAAGKPFIIYAESDKLEAVLDGSTEVAGSNNGLYGTLVYMDATALSNAGATYMLKNNELRPIGTNNHLAANRAYIKLDEIPDGGAPAGLPKHRVRAMPTQSNVATDINAINAFDAPVKMMIDGELFIRRGENLYDATGRLVK